MMIYLLGVLVSAVYTIVLGLLLYFSDKSITIGNLIFGVFICFMSWIAVIGYVAILIAAGVDLLIHQDFWDKAVFSHDEKYEKNEDETCDTK